MTNVVRGTALVVLLIATSFLSAGCSSSVTGTDTKQMGTEKMATDGKGMDKMNMDQMGMGGMANDKSSDSK